MAKTLELQFVTATGKIARFVLIIQRNRLTSVVNQSMDEIVSSGAFYTGSGDLVSTKGARIVERNVTDYELVS
ncbi:DUF2922 domain-containing protein [Bacillus salipaludis]|uniref:DUF2922 domain-containing protein n=1 Tax=Bacillus salipaludis TaxID=2547811 RepID=UPI002E240767|nr:DUF2922 domain-containing protein [Bacillus salipaludis]